MLTIPPTNHNNNTIPGDFIAFKIVPGVVTIPDPITLFTFIPIPYTTPKISEGELDALLESLSLSPDITDILFYKRINFSGILLNLSAVDYLKMVYAQNYGNLAFRFVSDSRVYDSSVS